jgi:hypothetical protein
MQASLRGFACALALLSAAACAGAAFVIDVDLDA